MKMPEQMESEETFQSNFFIIKSMEEGSEGRMKRREGKKRGRKRGKEGQREGV
jgi:hypothetical protein